MAINSSWLFVGLGNPGERYLKTRHNIGFLALDQLEEHFISLGQRPQRWQSKFDGLYTCYEFQGQKIYLLKPQTFMNRSGQSVIQCLQFFKIPSNSVCVFHDDLDIPLFQCRTKKGGGTGGHNGLASIDEHTHTADYFRVRIGIGRPSAHQAVDHYVLSPFSSSELSQLTDVLAASYQSALLITQGKMSQAQSLFHGKFFQK